MNANLQRYMMVLSLGVRFALAAANSAAQPYPESAPAVSAPPPPAAIRASSARSKSASADEATRSGQVINAPPLTLYHGEVQVLDLPDVTRIAVGSGEVLQAQVVASSQVVLIGQAAGTTSLRVWTRNGTQFSYQVAVRSFDISQIVRDVQDLLAGEPGISVRQVDGHVLIEGDYSNARAATRLEALQKIYPQIISTVPVRKPAPAVQIDKMVYMDVRVVEIEKDVVRQLGVNWGQQTTGGFTAALNLNAATKNPPLPKPANGTLFGIAANLSSQLDLAEQASEAWTLAEPTVSCKSGGEAKFTVGGEVPIPVANGPGVVQVVYKDYGIILEFKPVADDQGNISSTIVAEVSEPDSSLSNLANNGLVAFTKTRTETEVTLRENQTLVISGLLKDLGDRSAVGIPGAKDLPVLGHLFKSRNYTNKRTELVIVVTPHAVSAGSELSAAAVRQANELKTRVEPTINWTNARLAE
jgi:pilus assembly protein CpaC